MRTARVRLTPRGWGLAGAAVAATIVAYATGWPAMLAVGAFLGGVVVAGAVLVAVGPFRVQAERRLLPPVVERGREATVHLVLGGAAASAEWSDDVARTVQVVGTSSGTVGRVPSGGAVEVDYRVVPRRRGLAAIGPLRLERSDPLGVAVARRRSLPATELVVLPTIHDVLPPASLTQADADPSAAMVLGIGGEQRDVVSRPYRAGDPLRQVDWRSTAHRGELMVHAEAAATSVGTAVVLDARESSWSDGVAFEWGVEAAASLLADAMRHRAAARLVLDAGSAAEDDAALVALATADTRRTSGGLPDLIRTARASADVQVVHVITGAAAASEISGLPQLPHGTAGVVSIVGGQAEAIGVRHRAWRLFAPDPRRPVEEAWERG